MVGVLAVPLALALRPSDEPGAGVRTVASGELAEVVRLPALARSSGDPTPNDVAHSDSSSSEPSTADPLSGDAPAAAMGDGAPVDDSSAPVAPGEPTPSTSADAGDVAACSTEYTIVPGDYWVRVAEGAGVPLRDLFAVNAATVDTVIHPGDVICLPEGAAVPPPPPTTTTTTTTTTPATTVPATTSPATAPNSTSAPPTTAAPTTNPPSTNPPSTNPPSTNPPSTTVPATTTPATTVAPAPSRPPSSANPSVDQVQAMIREVWPEDQHDMAITVARRESNFRANAYNGWCCHGIFQIHWSAHRGWLADIGITSVEQLYDARTNIEIALRIHDRAGGWGPWSQTAY